MERDEARTDRRPDTAADQPEEPVKTVARERLRAALDRLAALDVTGVEPATVVQMERRQR